MTKVLDKAMRDKALDYCDRFFKSVGTPEFYKSIHRGSSPASYLVMDMDIDGSVLKKAKKIAEDYKVPPGQYSQKQWPYAMTVVGRHPSNPAWSTRFVLEDEELVHFRSIASGAACHGSFPQHNGMLNKTGYKKTYVLASNLDYLPGEDHAHHYISYLLDPKLSPYRSLLSHGYNVHYNEEGHTSGISIFVEDVPEEMWPMIKNFFVAARMARECPTHTKNFCDMVESGLDPRIAHLLMAQVIKVGNSWKILATSQKNSGHHWPISLGASDYGFNINRFWHSTLNIERASGKVNGLFSPMVILDNRTSVKEYKEKNFSQDELNKALDSWRQSLKTSFSTNAEGTINNIETLNQLFIDYLVKQQGLVL